MEPIEPVEGEGEQANSETEAPESSASKPPIEERFPADVAGSFGMSVDKLQSDMEVRQTDGFVTMDLITGPRRETPRE